MKRKITALFCIFCLFLQTTACGDDVITPVDPDEPTVTPETPSEGGEDTELVTLAQFRASVIKGETLEIPLTGTWDLGVSGFTIGDVIEITLRSDSGTSFTFTCTAAADTTGAEFPVPADFLFAGGMCNVTVRAGSTTTTGELFVDVIDTEEVALKTGYTSYGRVIDWAGNPLSGVSVSDGVLVTTTDSQGRYYLRSERKNGYVFVSVPANYTVAANRTVPRFFKHYENDKSTYEQISFILKPEDNSKARVLVFADPHLANRTNDIYQYETYFMTDIEEQISAAKTDNVPLYALALGDLCWDAYWYTNSYAPADYVETMAPLDIPVFAIPGNHDNDPNISDDFNAAAQFRENICPTYFSINIGDYHYIMMDNTIFNNAGGDVQDYECGFTDDEWTWLESDLSNVSADTPIILGMHIQMSNRPTTTSTFTYNMPAASRIKLTDLLGSRKVYLLSGHTHISYTNKISDNLTELNIAAVCGTWWWTGYYSSNKIRINGDGTPSGYKVFNFDGSDIEWQYKVLNRSSDYQFRAYDLKNCLITREEYCPTSKTNISDSFFSQYANGWDQESNTSNTTNVLINVFDYNDDWTIEVSENGNPLTVSRVEAYDPLHTILFNMCRMTSTNKGSTNMTFPTGQSTHFFRVTTSSATSTLTIKVTDSFGRSYTETMTRPRYLSDMYQTDNTY